MSKAIWPDGVRHTLQYVDFVFLSDDGENTVIRRLGPISAGRAYTKMFTEMQIGSYEVLERGKTT